MHVSPSLPLLRSCVLAVTVLAVTASGQGLRSIPPSQSLRPNVQGSGDQFGGSVAIEREFIVIGAAFGLEDTGIAHVFEWSPIEGQWNEVDALTSVSDELLTLFGHSVAISGTTIVVGAPNESSQGFPGVGVVSVFERVSVDPPNWELTAELRSSDASSDFGYSVDISGDTILVGAPAMFQGPGAAYVYERDLGGPGAWGEAQKLTVPNGVNHVSFGESVALDGDTAIVSRVREFGASIPTKIHVFERTIGTPSWAPSIVLHASDTPNATIDIAENVIGSMGDRLGAGDQLLIYERDALGSSAWRRVGTFEEPGGSVFFGQTLAVAPDAILLGCTFCNTLNGAVFLVQRIGGNTADWRLTATYEIGSSLAKYGSAVDLAGGTAVIGAIGSGTGPGIAYTARVPRLVSFQGPAPTSR